MSMWNDFIRVPASDFPDRLQAAPPARPLPRRRLLLAGLLLACLLPRIWMAWRWDYLWADSIYYLSVAQSLEQGDLHKAFRTLGLNTFPVILAGLRRTGLDWTIIGQWWSVLMASLAVLPLFGWIRRQFDDQVATFACLLYAFQPKFVGYAPLIIRDPTYWFFFSLSLYLTWRAVTEMRWWQFLASGVALTLTAYTRTEGWLLLVPLLLWAWWRLPAIAGARVRLALGTAASLAMIPLLVVAVNVTLLRNHDCWELGRLGQVRAAWSWWVSKVDGALVSPAAAAPPAESSDESPDPESPTTGGRTPAGCREVGEVASVPEKPSTLRTLRKTLTRLLKTMTYGYVVLIAVGLWCWRHVFFRRDQQATVFHHAILFTCIWQAYTRSGGIDIRYFLPIIMIALPYAALGLLQIGEWLVAPRKHAAESLPRRRAWAVAGALAGAILIGFPDMKLTSQPVMAQQTDLGKWILQQEGPRQTVLGPTSCLNLLAYHAQAKEIPFPKNFDGNSRTVETFLTRYKPGVVILWDDIYNPILYNARESVIADCERHGYRRVPREELPASCSKVEVLIADPGAPRTAAKPKAQPRRS